MAHEPPSEAFEPYYHQRRRGPWGYLVIGAVVTYTMCMLFFETDYKRPVSDGTSESALQALKAERKAFHEEFGSVPPEEDASFTEARAIVAGVDRDTAILGQMQTAAARDRAQEVTRTAQQLAQDLQAWEQRTKALLNDDEGRHLAADVDGVNAFLQLESTVESERWLREAAAIQQRAETTAALLEQSRRADPHYAPAAEISERLQSEQAQLQGPLQQLGKARQQLELLVKAAKGQSPAAKQTLAQAIEQVELERAGVYQKQLSEALLAERKERDRRTIEAQREVERLETERQERLLQERADSARREERHRQLVAIAKDPQVQSRYVAFLSEGSWQPHKLYAQFRAEIPGPISYAAMQQWGALADDENGYREFCKIATRDRTRPNSFNDRPRLAAPVSASDHQAMRKIHREWIELAPVYKELGLLAP